MASRQEEQTMSKPKMLVVDDEKDIADMVEMVGETAGFDVRTTYTSEDFQKIWQEYVPDVIVMDLVMPDMDGVELLLWLAENKCTGSIILISGYDGQYLKIAEHIGDAKGGNIIGSLTKPFEINELEEMLQQVLDANNA